MTFMYFSAGSGRKEWLFKMANGTRTPKKGGKSVNTRKPQNRTQTGKRTQRSDGAVSGIKKERPVKKNRSYVSAGILTLVVSIIIGIFTYSSNQDKIGIGGSAIHNCLLGLFSTSAYLLPPALFGLGIYTLKVKRTNKLFGKICFCILEIVLIGTLIMLFYKGEYPHIASLWDYGINGGLGGGVLGGMVAVALSKLIGKTASLVVVLAAFAAVLFAIFNFSYSDLRDMLVSLKSEEEEEKEETEVKPVIAKEDKPEKTAEKQEEKPQIDLGFLEEVASQLPQTDGVKELLEEQKKKNDEKPKKAENITDAEKEEVKGEIEKSIEKPFANYQFPPISILNEAARTSQDKRREMYETANKLMTVLKNFGVDAKLLQVTQGPTVTRYEIQPSTGVKLAKITSLSEDIALNLAVPTVLVAAVPGKAAVGIEIPNNTIGTVSVRELIESGDFKDAKSRLSVAFGKDIGGNVIIGDIAKFPHVLIAGATGSGKSVCLNTIVASILYKARPDEVKMIMIDPKVVELGIYNGIPHLLIPVVTDPKKAAGSLNWAVGEMMRRYALFAETGTRNISGYNEHIEKEDGEKMPQIVIIIDELADLMMVAAKEVEDYICRLAQLARAAGIHLIIATQRPSVDVITGLIKANIPSRIAFSVSSGTDSRTILDRNGAEKLLGKGDMLYHPTGMPNPIRVQGAFVSDEEIEKVVEFVKEHTEQTCYAEDLAEHIERMASGENGVTDDDDGEDADELLPQAIEIAAELGQISTAMIQRKMKVGYARAGRIIDQMETRGLISGPNGSKPRDVYLNRIRALNEDAYEAENPDEEEYDETDEQDTEE